MPLTCGVRVSSWWRIEIPSLTETALVYAFSPERGRWLIIGRLPSGGTHNPIVVQLDAKQFVDSLKGHDAGVLGGSASQRTARR